MVCSLYLNKYELEKKERVKEIPVFSTKEKRKAFLKEHNFRKPEDWTDVGFPEKGCYNCDNSEARYSDWCNFTHYPTPCDHICDLWEPLTHKKEYR